MSMKIIAEIICSPVGVGTSVADHVKVAVDTIKSFENIDVQTHPMGTVFQADDLDTVLEVVKKAHEAIFSKGADRVVTQVRIDDRRDKDRDMSDKVSAVTS